MSFLYTNSVKTLIAICAIILINFSVEFALKRVKHKRPRIKARIFVRYVSFFTLIFFMTKIWVEGFEFLLAIVGVVAAAFTITQKENLLNVIGWLIIMWRDSFAEGDYVTLRESSGIVQNIGVMYFTLEVQERNALGLPKGYLIKVPNSYITLHPFATLPSEHLILLEQYFVFRFESNVQVLQDIQIKLEHALHSFMEPLYHSYKGEEKRFYQAQCNKKLFHEPSVELIIEQHKIRGYKLHIDVYCLMRQEEAVIAFTNQQIIQFMIAHSDILLVESY